MYRDYYDSLRTRYWQQWQDMLQSIPVEQANHPSVAQRIREAERHWQDFQCDFDKVFNKPVAFFTVIDQNILNLWFHMLGNDTALVESSVRLLQFH